MRDAVKKIFADHVDSPKDMPLVRFLDYIAEGNVKTLQRYPLDWDETEKGKYLLKVLCMNPHKVEQEVNNLIQWPPVTYLGNLPSPLQEMISYDQTRSHPSGYDDKKPYHYLKLCKNIIKHWWLLPESVKVVKIENILFYNFFILILLCVLHLNFNRWNAKHGKGSSKKWKDGILRYGVSFTRHSVDQAGTYAPISI